MNRYEQLREEALQLWGEEDYHKHRNKLKLLLVQGPKHAHQRRPEHFPALTVALPPSERGILSCIVTVDIKKGGIFEHISVSLVDVREHRLLLPTWEELVLVRALAWDDTAEVYQVLPALEGDDAQPWVSINETLHLYRRRE